MNKYDVTSLLAGNYRAVNTVVQILKLWNKLSC